MGSWNSMEMEHSTIFDYNGCCIPLSSDIPSFSIIRKYGLIQMIPVAANDVAISIHAVLLTAFTLFQIAIYDRGSQKVSKISNSIVSAAWLSAIVCVFIAIPNHSWLWLVSCFSTIQVVMTVIKYIPQVVMNFRRKSTTGFSIGYILLDLLGGSSNYAQMTVQSIDQHSWVNFHGNIGKTLLLTMIPVAANDVAISIHAVLLTAFTLFQIAIYDRGSQKVSKISNSIVSAAWLSAIVCVFIAIPNHSWLWLVSCFSTIQVVMTVIKYIPQVVMNFRRKSTTGFSIGYILLDLLGGSSNYAQMTVQSIDQHSWVNFHGNIGKTLLLTVSTFFDLVFISQHYVLYPVKKTIKSPSLDLVTQESLVTYSDDV
ncbi:PQ-loop repeat family protein / transmembrane family protein [Artemisia annua]|uniref:PQ-loop repeat family protein / transmembrane family protein n=1 Tax=Artemisia annua TaxID=35608 RepID=A0A2U1QKE2_ARTAN|nr:PQ-loop repeat family protein / transmembrane family protein [Artemisia annua]